MSDPTTKRGESSSTSSSASGPSTSIATSEPSTKSDASSTRTTTESEVTDPSFGATPPSTAAAGDHVTSDLTEGNVAEEQTAGTDEAKSRIESGSRERVATLRAARERALGQSHTGDHAQGSASAITTPRSHHGGQTSGIYSPSHAAPPSPPHPPSRPSLVPPYLRRITYLMTIFLGVGGTIAGLCSIFILPLLQSSFAARAALTNAQKDRMERFVEKLKVIKAARMHRDHAALIQARRAAKGLDSESGDTELKEGQDRGDRGEDGPRGTRRRGGDEKDTNGRDENDKARDKGKGRAREPAFISEVETDTESAHALQLSEGDVRAEDEEPIPSTLLPDISPLSGSLSTLHSTRRNTSTTRTSLLSTIEAYTSALHRQLWNPTPRSRLYPGSGAVGMGSLDQNLARAGAGEKGKAGGVYADGFTFEDISDKSEEWDAVRKEIRAVKGMLLGRRTFAMP